MTFFEWYMKWQPEDVVSAISALGTAVVLLLVWRAMTLRDPTTARLRIMRQERDSAQDNLRKQRQSVRLIRRQVGLLQHIFDRLKLLRSKEAEAGTLKLMRAGWRQQDALIYYLAARIGLPMILGIVGYFLFDVLRLIKFPGLLNWAGIVGLILMGSLLPDFALKQAAKNRQKKLQKSLPDALDLLVICAEAGLSLDSALTRVSREMIQSAPEIADEFGLTAIELSFLPERRKALENLLQRTDMSSIRSLVNTLLQTEKYGTPLAHSLRVLSSEYRDQRLAKAEEKAARLPALMTVPMMVFIMPCLFIVLLGPSIIRILDALRNLNH